MDMLDTAQAYQDGGAPASSPPTQPPEFGGGVPSSTPSDALLKGLETNQRQKLKQEEGALGDIDRAYKRFEPEMEKHYNAIGAEMGKIKPWNEAEQQEKFYSSPLEAFGSMGSVFGIIASAFTHAPMENALNASAAAMTAMREGDEKKYKSAYQAWKDNMALIEKRVGLERERFTDALTLMKTNVSAGEAKFRNAAVLSGDKQTLLMLESGLPPDEIQKAFDARLTAFEKMKKASDLATQDGMVKDLYDRQSKEIAQNTQNPAMAAAQRVRLWNTLHFAQTHADDPKVQAFSQFIYENPTASAEEVAAFADKHGIIRQFGTAGGTGTPGKSGQAAATAAARAERVEWEKEKNEDGTPKFTVAQLDDMQMDRARQLEAEARPPTPNQVDKNTALVQVADNLQEDIGSAEKLMLKHNAITGLGGTFSRAGESIATALGGSNSSDFHEFETLVHRMAREWRQLEQQKLSLSRDSQANVDEVGKIVRGLERGDTKVITGAEYRELTKRITKMREQLLARDPRKRQDAPTESKPDSDVPIWKKYPKASAIESDEAAA